MGDGSILSATSLRNLFQVPRTSGGQECCTSEPYTVLAKPSESRMIVVTSGRVLLCSNFSIYCVSSVAIAPVWPPSCYGSARIVAQ
jgi:hypothetical protein